MEAKRWFCQFSQIAKDKTQPIVTIKHCRSRNRMTRNNQINNNPAASHCWSTNQLLSKPHAMAAKNSARN
ncbi:hypothetical protein LASHA2_19940 [Lactiplantibacillus plantarum]|nr:hypothetical protein COY2906_11000 [Lactiplantibacillus plantarum]